MPMFESERDGELSSREACEMLGISRGTLQRLMDEGTLVPVNIHFNAKVLRRQRMYWFRRVDVEKLLEEAIEP